jgi:4-alpha-glucanotransferase
MGEELDSVMNYPFADGVLAFLRGRITAQAFKNVLEGLRENYPHEVFYALMNLISSHDVPRAASLLGGAPDKGTLTREQEAQYRLSNDDAALAEKRMKLASAIQFFMPGVPCIYYGDEALSFGLMDPFNRAAYPWGHEDSALMAHYRMLSKLRNDTTVLRTGRCLFDAQGEDVFVIIRFDESGAYALAVNRALQARPTVIDASAVYEGPDAGRLEHAALKARLDPMSARIFKLK